MPILAFIMSPIGRWVAIGVVALAALSANDLYFYRKGENHVQAKWDAAVQAAITQGKKARDDAERNVGADPDGGVRDNDNRDQP